MCTQNYTTYLACNHTYPSHKTLCPEARAGIPLQARTGCGARLHILRDKIRGAAETRKSTSKYVQGLGSAGTVNGDRDGDGNGNGNGSERERESGCQDHDQDQGGRWNMRGLNWWMGFRIPDERRVEREGLCADCSWMLKVEMGRVLRGWEMGDEKRDRRERGMDGGVDSRARDETDGGECEGGGRFPSTAEDGRSPDSKESSAGGMWARLFS
ncbi:hypothetical protein N7539_004637 [Penicillium diatomitis]|uniref:Uncharacterized protein n=1 Tax=Penicillium diatomitis TaxID=2819901 RepID=A0A9X0BYZ1_9EURO|nr:uncharacterized protein N7539_004637 [Penicillium diatomitis]KAJ5489747.1 hypothetical protein N7539_004637 [Penicillium diatomitis]